MRVLFLAVLTILGLWYNWKATRHWWEVQKNMLPSATDVAGWIGVLFSAVWYLFVFVFFAGLTLNNTLFR